MRNHFSLQLLILSSVCSTVFVTPFNQQIYSLLNQIG